MSASDDVMQKKSHDTPVIWREYEALRDHLTLTFNNQHEKLENTVQGVDLKLNDTDATVNNIQTTVTAMQTELHTLTEAVNNLRLAIEQPRQEDFDDADSVHDNDDQLVNGRGRGIGQGRGRGFAPVHARRVAQPQEDDALGKPRFSIPSFDGQGDVEDYLTWELKIEKLWRLHDYTEDRKVKLASSEFDGYALRWWDGIVRARHDDNDVPIQSWREMKAAMRARFVPTNYLRTVYDKLQQLKQGVMPVDARRAHVPPQEEDPLGKPRFSIPSFDGQGDVEDYLTWELKIERLWQIGRAHV